MASEKLPTQHTDIELSLGSDQSGCQRSFMDNLYEKIENLAAPQLEMPVLHNKVKVMCTEDNQDYFEKINDLHCYLDTVKQIVKPGCSEDLLKAALDYMSSLVNILSLMSPTEKLKASL